MTFTPAPARIVEHLVVKWKRNYATNSKLTESKVIEIYEHYKHERYDEFELAELFGVSLTTVYNIVRGRSWQWLCLDPIYLER